jgi:hypothetical protein
MDAEGVSVSLLGWPLTSPWRRFGREWILFTPFQGQDSVTTSRWYL